ncbi:DUF1804 family protein [Clostridium felsineum]|uniref:Uncharacterized protein n=1 Tax=Clostridium felsineum TaxID=36839 RepID=A0A1S8MDT3_9CLOT|nr:DUF1804 family protein [Clostridium felsineum]URZ06476.1 hypothetical protein CLROS_018090 [Clostridium felsineum]URZ11511.1 hypothetical protein CROST_022280 [Clostridium felsineum]
MNNARAPDKKELIRKAYEAGEGSFQYLADKYGVKVGTIKSWSKRDRENGEPWIKIKRKTRHATKRKKKATKQKTEANATEMKTEKVAKDGKEEKTFSNDKMVEAYKLTERQKLFAEIYVRTPIAYKAAIKAGYSPSTAYVESSRLLRVAKVKAYIDYLKELKRQSIMLEVEDLVDLNMRIAFGDIKDYVSFGQRRVPIINNGKVVMMENSVTGQEEVLTKKINVVELKEDFEVDGEIISEIKTSRQGTSVKLEDRQKAIQWLTDYFGWNPDSKYKKDFDNKKLQLERERLDHQKEVDKNKMW